MNIFQRLKWYRERKAGLIKQGLDPETANEQAIKEVERYYVGKLGVDNRVKRDNVKSKKRKDYERA